MKRHMLVIYRKPIGSASRYKAYNTETAETVGRLQKATAWETQNEKHVIDLCFFLTQIDHAHEYIYREALI